MLSCICREFQVNLKQRVPQREGSLLSYHLCISTIGHAGNVGDVGVPAVSISVQIDLKPALGDI